MQINSLQISNLLHPFLLCRPFPSRKTKTNLLLLHIELNTWEIYHPHSWEVVTSSFTLPLTTPCWNPSSSQSSSRPPSLPREWTTLFSKYNPLREVMTSLSDYQQCLPFKSSIKISKDFSITNQLLPPCTSIISLHIMSSIESPGFLSNFRRLRTV